MKAERARQLMTIISQENDVLWEHRTECERRLRDLEPDEEIDYDLANYIRKVRREMVDLADMPPPREPIVVLDDV